MAISDREMMYPRFIRYKEGATLMRDDARRFDQMTYSYGERSRSWRNQPQPGYNAQHPSIRADRVNLRTDVPYIRTR
jgi:hypothetical protein